ncbi:MAG: MFS transporter [Candidatus Bathyarchaeia archaeon]
MTEPKSKGSKGLLRVLRNRNFTLLFYAGAASTGGFSLGQVALTWLVYVTTGSALDVAYVALSSTVASVLLSVIGGTLVDRQNRKWLMILSDLLRALGLVVLAVYLYFAGFSLPLVLVVSFILGTFSTIFNPAQRAVIPSILKSDEVADANGLVQVANSVFQSVASAAGGAIVATIGAVAALGINATTFAISAVLTMSMTLGALVKPSLTALNGEVRKGFVSDAADGVKYITSNKGLLYLTVSAGFINLFFAMMIPFVVVYATNVLNGGVAVYGSLLAAFAVGMAPGALLVGRTKAVAYAGIVWGGTGLLAGATMLLSAFTQSFIVAFVLFLVVGVISGYANVTWLSAVQLIVPSEMQGRYFGVDQLGSFAVMPVGQVLGAFIIQSMSVKTDFIVAAVGISVISLVFLLSKDMRAVGYSAEK